MLNDLDTQFRDLETLLEENSFSTPIQDFEVDEAEVEELRKSNSFFGGSSYLRLSRARKMAYLWNEVNADHSSGSFPSKFSLAKIFVQSMATVFD